MAILARPRSVRFVQMLRLAVLLFIAAVAFFVRRDSYGDSAVYVVDIPLISLIIANILSTLWLYQHLRIHGTLEEEQLYLQVFLDVLAMALVVFYTGASESTLTLIFLVPVILASAFLYLRGSLFAASLSAVLLAALFLLDTSGWLADYGQNYRQTAVDFSSAADAQLLILEWILITLALFAAAATSGYVAERQLFILGEIGVLTHRLERFRLSTSDVLSHLDSGLVTIDSDSKIIFLNRAAREILRIEGLEPEGRSFEMVLSGKLEPLSDLVRKALDGIPLSRRNEVDIELDGGSVIPLGITPTVLRDEQDIRGVVLIFQDLTEAKVLEEKIRRQDRLAVIGELAAGIAHELRNPLASISGSAEVLSSGLDLDEEDRKLLDLVVNESSRINDIVEEFLNYSRIQKTERQPVLLRDMIEDVMSLAKNHPSYGDGRDMEIALKDDIVVMADPAQLKQVFLNLVLNGLEALDGPGFVRVTHPPEGEGLEVDRDMVEIWVQDNGPGIPPDEIKLIFEPFYTNKRGGTGLGLAVVQRIIESHDGQILYKPDVGANSTFRVFLPRGEKDS